MGSAGIAADKLRRVDSPVQRSAIFGSLRTSLSTLNAGSSSPRVTEGIRFSREAPLKQVTGSPVHILAGDKDDYDDPDGCLTLVASLPANARRHFAVTVYKGATFAWDSRFDSATYESGANKGKGGVVKVIANAEIARESQAFAVSYFKKYLAAD